MNPLLQCKTTAPLLIILTLICFALSPSAQAVVPAPDGGYPGANTAEGQAALLSLTTGGFNTAVGYFSLRSITTASFNTAIGAGTLLVNTGDENTATGAGALLNNTVGPYNTANGGFALLSNITGNGNTANGDRTLFSNTTGDFNTANGENALHYNMTGNGNVALGAEAGTGVFTADNVIAIGHVGFNVSFTTWIENVYGVATQSGTTAPVVVSDSGQLGTVASSERFKKDIATMQNTSEAILSLRPVIFHYKTDTKGTPQFGLIAEEVAKVNPALVLPDKEGKPYTVRYDAVNAMLLNEFLKEHRKNEEQEARMARQQKQIEALTAGLQKVSAQLAAASPSRGGLEASKPAP
jgi:hypothetical protein